MEQTRGDYTISTDPARMNVDAIHAYLSRSYWAEGVPREIVERSLLGSLTFGLFHRGAQVGLARVVTDRATFAYLCDVYVLEEHRGRGLSKWMMEFVMKHPELQGVRRFQLVTRDAHGLYSRFGFKPPMNPERHLEIFRDGMYDAPADR